MPFIIQRPTKILLHLPSHKHICKSSINKKPCLRLIKDRLAANTQSQTTEKNCSSPNRSPFHKYLIRITKYLAIHYIIITRYHLCNSASVTTTIGPTHDVHRVPAGTLHILFHESNGFYVAFSFDSDVEHGFVARCLPHGFPLFLFLFLYKRWKHINDNRNEFPGPEPDVYDNYGSLVFLFTKEKCIQNACGDLMCCVNQIGLLHAKHSNWNWNRYLWTSLKSKPYLLLLRQPIDRSENWYLMGIQIINYCFAGRSLITFHSNQDPNLFTLIRSLAEKTLTINETKTKRKHSVSIV